MFEDCEHGDHVKEFAFKGQPGAIGYIVFDQVETRIAHIG